MPTQLAARTLTHDTAFEVNNSTDMRISVTGTFSGATVTIFDAQANDAGDDKHADAVWTKVGEMTEFSERHDLIYTAFGASVPNRVIKYQTTGGTIVVTAEAMPGVRRT